MEEHRKEVVLLNLKIRELEDRSGERGEVDISHISKISRKFGREYGQLYGGDDKIGKI